MAGDFETEWRKVRQQVLHFCYRSAGNRDDAEDIFQQVALRAWRGFATFRGECAFLSWAIAIARRETARIMSRKLERTRQESSLELFTEDSAALLPSAPGPSLPAVSEKQALCSAARAAVAQEVLTESEADVVIARLSLAECSWEQIGAMLSLEGGTCAVIYCRAIPKLRVFLFLHQPDLLGGRDEIAAAYASAKSATEDPLSPNEAEAFRILVLQGRSDYRKAGWMSSLRAACGKISRRLSLP